MSRRSANKDQLRLVRRCEDQGLEVTYSKGGHYKIKAPKGLVVLPSTPSDWRGHRNNVALLRRHGVDL